MRIFFTLAVLTMTTTANADFATFNTLVDRISIYNDLTDETTFHTPVRSRPDEGYNVRYQLTWHPEDPNTIIGGFFDVDPINVAGWDSQMILGPYGYSETTGSFHASGSPYDGPVAADANWRLGAAGWDWARESPTRVTILENDQGEFWASGVMEAERGRLIDGEILEWNETISWSGKVENWAVVVPEPSSVVLLLIGVLGILRYRFS